MLKKLIFVLIPILALVGGGVAGHFLRPAPEKTGQHEGEHTDDAMRETTNHPHSTADTHGDEASGHGDKDMSMLKFANQFFVPLERNGDGGDLMILTLTLEVGSQALAGLHKQESRLRDLLLRQLLITANSGGFDGNYTLMPRMQKLTADLLQVVQQHFGDDIKSVLIEDIARQMG